MCGSQTHGGFSQQEKKRNPIDEKQIFDGDREIGRDCLYATLIVAAFHPHGISLLVNQVLIESLRQCRKDDTLLLIWNAIFASIDDFPNDRIRETGSSSEPEPAIVTTSSPSRKHLHISKFPSATYHIPNTSTPIKNTSYRPFPFPMRQRASHNPPYPSS